MFGKDRDGLWSSRAQGLVLPRRSALALSAAAMLGARAARAQTTSKPPSSPKGQVIVGLSQEPTVFNPLMPAIEVDQGVWWQVFSPLWGVDPDGNFFPQLAAEVPTLQNGGISEDGLSWKVKLRSGVKWHDGAPFSADDVKFTLDLINNPNFRAGSRNGHNLVKDVKVLSPTEVAWRMDKAYAPYPSILAWTFIVPKHVLEKASDPNTAPFNNAPIGTGAFRWGERVAGDHITLHANRDFFGDGPHLEHVTFKYIPDLTVMYTQFRTGDIDYTDIQGITPDHYAEAKTLKDRHVIAVPQAFIESITLNLGKPVFADPVVRQALYLAMNKQPVIDAIYYGLPTPTESYLPRQSWAFNPDLPKHEYDIAKAKKLLDDAGWKPGAGGVREKNGVRLEFSNSTTAGNHVREQAQQLLQQDWQSIGAAMQIKNMPAAVIWGDYFNLSKYDSVMVGEDFLVGADPDPSLRLASTSCPAKGGAGENTMQYANPKVDALLSDGSGSFDQQKRKQDYLQVQELVRQDLPILPMFQYANVKGTKAGLVGFRPNVNSLSDCWNINTWYWET
jgi:peptide/nickel transport system substrate-binding protein